ncbi:hypothetical protein J6590_045774 [Homalodisca vitripennis]|nr:hypothetical protein J6590_045774 [Homalodisca vitripennis]
MRVRIRGGKSVGHDPVMSPFCPLLLHGCRSLLEVACQHSDPFIRGQTLTVLCPQRSRTQ